MMCSTLRLFDEAEQQQVVRNAHHHRTAAAPDDSAANLASSGYKRTFSQLIEAISGQRCVHC
jgi:hypothetical protein